LAFLVADAVVPEGLEGEHCALEYLVLGLGQRATADLPGARGASSVVADVAFAGGQAGEDADPRQAFLANLEERLRLQHLDHIFVKARVLAFLDEPERTQVVLGRNDHIATLLDYYERGGTGPWSE